MIGIKSTILLALVAITFPGVAWLHAEDRMRAGLWEITTTIGGKPAGDSHNTCFTPAMVELTNAPAKMLREATEKSATKSGNCTLKDFSLDGKKISMTLSCGGKSSAYVSTYSVDAFETVVTSTEAGVKTAIQMKGRRIGDCK
jgi:hypothetical protein